MPVKQILCRTVVKLSKLIKQGAQRHHEFYGQKLLLLPKDVEIKKYLNDDNLITQHDIMSFQKVYVGQIQKGRTSRKGEASSTIL